jgi:hypothetical protein
MLLVLLLLCASILPKLRLLLAGLLRLVLVPPLLLLTRSPAARKALKSEHSHTYNTYKGTTNPKLKLRNTSSSITTHSPSCGLLTPFSGNNKAWPADCTHTVLLPLPLLLPPAVGMCSPGVTDDTPGS